MASEYGKEETVRTLVELGVDKEAKDDVVRNLMMMMMAISMVETMMMMMMAISMVETMMMMIMILVDEKNDCR